MGIESAPKQDPEEKPNTSRPTGKTDWSFVDAAREGSNPTLQAQPEATSQPVDAENEAHKQAIRQQEYNKTREQARLFRAEHGITKTADELEKEDRELRKKFGLE